jgi:hypothetical protein
MPNTIMLNGNTPPYQRNYLMLPGECGNQFQEQMRQLRDNVLASDLWPVVQKFHETLQNFDAPKKGFDVISVGNDASKDVMEGNALKGLLKYTSKVGLLAKEDQLVETALDIAQEKLFGKEPSGPTMG